MNKTKSARDKNPATLNLLNFLANREGLTHIEAHAYCPTEGAISPDDDRIVWSGRNWELIKNFCEITGEFNDFLLWNRRECCGLQIQADEWDWSGWDDDDLIEYTQDDLIEDTQTALVSAIATFEQAQTLDANVHQLSLFEVAA